MNINDLLFGIAELILIYVTIISVTRYVFLEKGLESKKQTVYYLITFVSSLITSLIMGDFGIGTIVLSVLSGLNIVLARSKHKIVGFFLIIPIVGIVDGLMLPIISMPMKLLDIGNKATQIYQFCIYLLLLSVVILFYFAGKSWRAQFAIEIADRKLKKWELGMLSFVGILLMFFSSLMESPLSQLGDASDSNLKYMVLLLGLSSFAMTIAVIVVVMVGNKQTFYHDKVSSMQFNIIIMMAEIVESRDKNTGGHIRRTAKYVEIIAKQLKKDGHYADVLTDSYIKDMMVAAPLHDIGKIHVSDVILNKPDRLTEEEFAIMKSHAKAGRDLLEHAKEHLGEFSYLDIATQMAGIHHEWWDGSKKGYPNGIAGDEIPVCARVMAVADVFDALISKRCYKEPMPLQRAYDIIREESGTHFDPLVVDAFFRAQDQIEAALNVFEKEGEHNCMIAAAEM